MSLLVVAVLSLLWLGFFLPSLLQLLRASSPFVSATTFQESLRRLGEAPDPRPPGTAARSGPPSRAAAVTARRRDTLAVLSAGVVAGALIAIGFAGWADWAFVPPVLALAAYVVMLRRHAVRHSARRTRPRAVQAPPATAIMPAPEDPAIVPSVARRSDGRTPERMAG